MKVHTTRAAALALVFLASAFAPYQQSGAPSADPLVRASNLGDKALPIDGHDPVAYFPQSGGKPAKGKKDLTVTYRGALYRFASEANRELFRAHPSDYAPAFGGWCAYAMASGDRVEIDPESFLIEDGSLFLFYDGLFADTRKSWLKEGPEALRVKADTAWLAYAHEPRKRDADALSLVDGRALGGNDPVSYFGSGDASKPLAGDAKFAVTERGVTYHFATAANRDTFLVNPSAYEPAFGGFDGLALARGSTVAADPMQFAFTSDGHVVLFAAPVEGTEAPTATWARDRAKLEPLATAAFAKHVADVAKARAERKSAK